MALREQIGIIKQTTKIFNQKSFEILRTLSQTSRIHLGEIPNLSFTAKGSEFSFIQSKNLMVKSSVSWYRMQAKLQMLRLLDVLHLFSSHSHEHNCRTAQCCIFYSFTCNSYHVAQLTLSLLLQVFTFFCIPQGQRLVIPLGMKAEFTYLGKCIFFEVHFCIHRSEARKSQYVVASKLLC